MSISVRNLIKRFDAFTVVHGVSFEVAVGEFVSLLGPSGCGKTTTLRCICGLEDANAGEIRIGDTVVSAPELGVLVPVHERQIGMVFQSYAVWPHMTVSENVGFPLSVRKLPASAIKRQVEEALAIVGLSGLKDRHPSQLSGGQQQRVALARAIVGRPKVLLFDEPLSNLDAKLREGTRTEIRRLQRELGVAALYVTHDQEEALSISDRVIVMDKGWIEQIGTPKDLYRRPINHFVADFVGRASFIDVAKREGSDHWRTPDGTPLELVDAATDGHDTYQAMLRPEDIDIIDASSASELRGRGLPGTIRESHYLGAYTEYVVEAAGAKVKAHSRRDFDVGASVTLDIRPQAVRLVAWPEAKRRSS